MRTEINKMKTWRDFKINTVDNNVIKNTIRYTILLYYYIIMSEKWTKWESQEFRTWNKEETVQEDDQDGKQQVSNDVTQKEGRTIGGVGVNWGAAALGRHRQMERLGCQKSYVMEMKKWVTTATFERPWENF
jgi:hypothetical protein